MGALETSKFTLSCEELDTKAFFFLCSLHVIRGKLCARLTKIRRDTFMGWWCT